MSFARIWVFHLFWLLPVVVFLLVAAGRRKKKALQAFAEPSLMARLASIESRSKTALRGILVTLAVGLVIFALAGPQWGDKYEEVTQKGVDILLCLDVSQSMMVEDVSPNRLERAKREDMDLIRVVTGDRMGLVAFAGKAFLQCPLTLDYSALEMFLDQITPDLIPVSGTNLGDAIDVAAAAFDADSNTDKVVLLLTDGEDNEGKGTAAAQKAAQKGIKIFVFGIGDPSGGPVPASSGGGFEKDKSGQMVLSKLDEETLARIAQTTGGDYTRSIDGDLDLDKLYFEGIKQKTQQKMLKSGKIKVEEERFFIFLMIAWVLLLFERMIHERLFARKLD